MIENAASDRRNFWLSLTIATIIALAGVGLGLAVAPGWWSLLVVAAAVYWWMRRKTVRRRRVLATPMDDASRGILNQHVSFYRVLPEERQRRFEKMVQVFLDEVTITGIETEVDATTRMLVAASAIIPIFGFDDFEYSGLGEVLIYPDSFNRDYQRTESDDRNILGMVGSRHLSGVMILSKPSLKAGFADDRDKRNVGIHEFAHLVDKQSGDIDGVPPTMPSEVVDPWVRWVGNELQRDKTFRDIDDYAYTNEAEYFAVLSEYFFENPTQLQRQHPKLYKMMRRMYHLDTKGLFSGRRKKRRKRRVGRNDPCPCGSGEKYKRCCRLKRLNT